MKPKCSICGESSDKKITKMAGVQEVAIHLCHNCYNAVKKDVFSNPKTIDFCHPIKNVWYHLFQKLDKDGNVKYYTDGVEEEMETK